MVSPETTIDTSAATVIVEPRWKRALVAVALWFDASAASTAAPDDERINGLRIVPFVAMHAMCLGVFFVGFSRFALGLGSESDPGRAATIGRLSRCA